MFLLHFTTKNAHQADTVTHLQTQKTVSLTTVNPVFIAAATITVVCSRNENENAKVGVWL